MTLARRHDSGSRRPNKPTPKAGGSPQGHGSSERHGSAQGSASGGRRGSAQGPGSGERRRSRPPDARSGGHDWIHGHHAIAEALGAGRRELFALWLKKGPPRRELEPIVEAAKAAGVPIKTAEAEELTARVGGDEGLNWQGALLEAGRIPEFSGIGPLLRAQPEGGPIRLVALDGVEDPQNVGAIARVADAAGIGGLLLTDRRAAPLTPAVSRASAGAVEWLPVARVPNLVRALSGLKERGVWVLGADLRSAEPLWSVSDALWQGDFVLVMGAEGKGLRPSTRAELDLAVEIPMAGQVASLNVATATAVLLFEAMRRSHQAPG